MDMQKTVREIGMFETAVNLAKVSNSVDVVQKVGASMPLPDDGIEGRVGQISEWLLSFGKSKYMFLTPEIALIRLPVFPVVIVCVWTDFEPAKQPA